MEEGRKVRKALVTGGTGFIGSHLVRRLVNDGWEVHLIVRPGSGLGVFEGIKGRIRTHRHDGSIEGMFAIFDAARPDVVFHLASLFLSQHRPEDIEPLLGSNLVFATELLEAMARHRVCLLVNTGTSWQHYENSDFNPVNLYAATKQAFEAILAFYTESTPMKSITLKLYDTYGPGDNRPKLFTLLRNAAEEKKRLEMSPGEQLIDLVYVDDAVDAFIISAERLLEGLASAHENYAVSSGSPVKLKDLVETYARVTGANLDIVWGGRPYRAREVMVPWSKGRLLPGWSAKTALQEGIMKMEGMIV